MTPLPQALAQFQTLANANPRIANLVKGWEPVMVIEAVDSGTTRYLPVRAGRVEAVLTDCIETSHMVHLRANEDVLTAVFEGRTNPASAFLDGSLEIFANEKDHVKLDAISLVLWGA
jgi:hypothetical protein